MQKLYFLFIVYIEMEFVVPRVIIEDLRCQSLWLTVATIMRSNRLHVCAVSTMAVATSSDTLQPMFSTRAQCRRTVYICTI